MSQACLVTAERRSMIAARQRSYPLEETAEALAPMKAGRVCGKIVLTVS
jgi:NADPH:quinone reductase-like Zn-dependent oxidoreductase